MKTVSFDESEWQLVPVEATEEMLEAGFHAIEIGGGVTEHAWAALLAAAPTPAEAPADVARDAERWLSQRDLELLVTFGMQADDCDADGHTLSKEQTRRLCELGVLRNVGFGRHEMTAFGDSVFGAHHLRHGISLPLQTHAEYNAARERQGGE